MYCWAPWAGFANIVFCQPRTKVIELRSSNANPMYENVAKKNDLNYNSIVIEPSNKTSPNQQGHIQVPIGNLSKILENK